MRAGASSRTSERATDREMWQASSVKQLRRGSEQETENATGECEGDSGEEWAGSRVLASEKQREGLSEGNEQQLTPGDSERQTPGDRRHRATLPEAV